MCIYIYIYRERERERGIIIYIYIIDPKIIRRRRPAQHDGLRSMAGLLQQTSEPSPHLCPRFGI